MYLPLHDHGVDNVATVVNRYEAANVNFTRALIDIDDTDIAAEWEGQIRRIIVGHCLKACLHSLGMVGVRRKRDLLNSLGAFRRAFDIELPRLPLQILLTR